MHDQAHAGGDAGAERPVWEREGAGDGGGAVFDRIAHRQQRHVVGALIRSPRVGGPDELLQAFGDAAELERGRVDAGKQVERVVGQMVVAVDQPRHHQLVAAIDDLPAPFGHFSPGRLAGPAHRVDDRAVHEDPPVLDHARWLGRRDQEPAIVEQDHFSHLPRRSRNIVGQRIRRRCHRLRYPYPSQLPMRPVSTFFPVTFRRFAR